jgi:hypothetical protein
VRDPVDVEVVAVEVLALLGAELQRLQGTLNLRVARLIPGYEEPLLFKFPCSVLSCT